MGVKEIDMIAMSSSVSLLIILFLYFTDIGLYNADYVTLDAIYKLGGKLKEVIKFNCAVNGSWNSFRSATTYVCICESGYILSFSHWKALVSLFKDALKVCCGLYAANPDTISFLQQASFVLSKTIQI